MTNTPGNFISTFDDALSSEFCDQIINKFEASPQSHVAGKIGAGVNVEKKDSVDCCISEYQEWNEVNQQLFNTTLKYLTRYVTQYPHLVCGALAPTIRLQNGDIIEVAPDNVDLIPEEQLTGIILNLYRPGFLNLQKYPQGRGGYHHWHSEIYPRENNCETLHRVLLFMYFLNDVERGGETEFYYQDTKVKPKKGTMVIAPAGFTHTHKGSVPETEDKYIVTSWILFQRAEQIFSKR